MGDIMINNSENRKGWRTVAVSLPIILVNAVSVFGQTVYWYSHIFNLAGAIAFAVALESVAVYLAYHAHLAQISNDASLRLRWASYIFGAIIGLLNGSHYLNNGKITAAAVGMCLLSASSPWLWAIHTRRESRPILRDNGLIDAHAVRLGGNRVFWHPWKSAGVMSFAAWSGENRPAEAITQWETYRADALAAQLPPEPRLSLSDAVTQADAVRVAIRDSGLTAAPEIASWLAARGWPAVSAAYIRTIRSVDGRKDVNMRRSGIRAITGRHSSPAIGSYSEADQGK
jgi:hypothetical protein